MVQNEAMILIEEAKSLKVKLTEWEEIFVKNIQRLGAERRLSDKQTAIVRRIYEKASGYTDKVYPQRI